jgi:hypothetical protein
MNHGSMQALHQDFYYRYRLFSTAGSHWTHSSVKAVKVPFRATFTPGFPFWDTSTTIVDSSKRIPKKFPQLIGSVLTHPRTKISNGLVLAIYKSPVFLSRKSIP